MVLCPKNKIMLLKKHVTVFTAVCFLITSVFGQLLQASIIAPVAPVSNQIFNSVNSGLIPFNIGRVTDALYNGQDSDVVINIQDLHSHSQTQRNIDAILKILDKKYGLDKVYVEGAWGQVNTKWLSSIKDKNIKKQIIDNMLESGRLTGSEYFASEIGREKILEGIEQEQIYKDNLKRLQNIYDARQEIEKYILNLKYILDQKSEAYYCNDNRKLNRIINKHKEDSISDERYFNYLLKNAKKAGIDFRNYKEITKLLEVLKANRAINIKKANKEIALLLEELKTVLSYEQYKTLSEKLNDKTTEIEFYDLLMQTAGSKGLLSLKKYNNIDKFLRYIMLSRSVNPIELACQDKILTKQLYQKNSENEFEREIYYLKEYVDYTEGYLNNKLTADEYERFVQGRERFLMLWKKYIDCDQIIDLNEYFGLFEDFYKQNVERNKYFVKNVIGIMPETHKQGIRIKSSIDHQNKVLEQINKNRNIKVVITGGFHTYGFTKLLEDRGVNYIVITPNITENTLTAEQKYEEIFRQQSGVLYETLQKMFVSQTGKGAVLNYDVLKAVSGQKDMLSILNTMLAELETGIELVSYNKIQDGFIFNTSDGNMIKVDDKSLSAEVKHKEVLSQKDLYRAFLAFDIIQELNEKIRYAKRQHIELSSVISGKDIYSAAQRIEKISDVALKEALRSKLGIISILYKTTDIESQDSRNNPVYAMMQALAQAQIASKSRSIFMSFTQPPVGAYLVNEAGFEGRGFNDINSFLHAETLAIINFLEDSAAKSHLSKAKKKEIAVLFEQIKINGKSLKSDIFRTHKTAKKLKINYAEKTIDDLFNETNGLLKYIDDTLGNPLHDAELYCTLAPCNKCAKTMIALKMKTVVFGSYPANKSHQYYENLYTNGTGVIPGILQKETDKMIRNYRIMNSSVFMTKTASFLQKVRREIVSFVNLFKMKDNSFYVEQQNDILLNKLFASLSGSDTFRGNVEYAVLCGNDYFETYKYAFEMLKSNKIEKLIIPGGCGRLTMPLLKAVRNLGIEDVSSSPFEKILSMSDEEFSSLEQELLKSPSAEIKARLTGISPNISEAEIIKFVMLNVIAKQSGISEIQTNLLNDRIILEPESGNTLENLKNSKKLIPENVKRIGIIQTPVQQLRTMATANGIFDSQKLLSMTVSKTDKTGIALLQAVLGEYARLIIYTLKGDILLVDDLNNTGLNAVSEETLDSIFTLLENSDQKQITAIRNNLRILFRALKDDSYSKVLELLSQNAQKDGLDNTKSEKIKKFINWIYEKQESILPASDIFKTKEHPVLKAVMTAFLESPYIFAASFSEKFKDWFLRQHPVDNKEVRQAGFTKIRNVVRISTFISFAFITVSLFLAVPPITITISTFQWFLSLIIPHAVWNIKHPEAQLKKTPRGELINFDIFYRGERKPFAKSSGVSGIDVISKRAYALAKGILWKKAEIEKSLYARQSSDQATVAPQVNDSQYDDDLKPSRDIYGQDTLFVVKIPNINDKLPARYMQTYAKSPKSAVANILFKIFKAIQQGNLTNGKYVNIPYSAEKGTISEEYDIDSSDIGNKTENAGNIAKILSIIFQDYKLNEIISGHKSSSLAQRTGKTVSRNLKQAGKAYQVVIPGLNKHKNLEVYQQVYALSEEQAVKNAVKELAAAKERGELTLGWYADVALNSRNINIITNAVLEKYQDKISNIVTEILEVTKISEDPDIKISKEFKKEKLQTTKNLYPQSSQNDGEYKFSISLQIPQGSGQIFKAEVTARSPKQALYFYFLKYYRANKQAALNAERTFWQKYDSTEFAKIFECPMSIAPFVKSKESQYDPKPKKGQKQYSVVIADFNDTEELKPYTAVYGDNEFDAVEKAVKELISAKERGEISSGWYEGIAVTKEKTQDIINLILKKYKSNIGIISNEIFKKTSDLFVEEILELQNIIDWNNLSLSELDKLEQSLRKIGAWDDKTARAAMMYVIENKITPAVSKDNRIEFYGKDGKVFNFWISQQGVFAATKVFYGKMEKLSKILNIADMDENIAPRAKPMNPQMKNIFSKLHLYSMGAPVIVTGAIFERLQSRLNDIHPVIRNLIGQMFIVSARERITYKGGIWLLDDDYLTGFSKAQISDDERNRIKKAFYKDIEMPWYNLFFDFADTIKRISLKKTDPSYIDFAFAAVEGDYDFEIEYIVNLLHLENRFELFKMFSSKKRKEIKQIINQIYEQAKLTQTKEKLLKIMQLISLLELIRVYMSQDQQDASEKEYINSEAVKKEPMIKNNERTSYLVTQIRPMAVRDCLADYCADVINNTGLRNFTVRAGGKSTIDFYKKDTNKAKAIEYLHHTAQIPSANIIYSGDEMLGGVDSCVVDLKNNDSRYKKLTIINSGNDKVEGTLFVKDIYPGMNAIDANAFIFEQMFDIISYNIGQIASNPDFTPSNVVQDLKKTINQSQTQGSAQNTVSAANIFEPLMSAGRAVSSFIERLQLASLSFIYKDKTSYTVVAQTTDSARIETAQMLASKGIKVNLILLGSSGLIKETQERIEQNGKLAYGLTDKKGNLTVYGGQKIDEMDENEMLEAIIKSIKSMDKSDIKILDITLPDYDKLSEANTIRDMVVKPGASATELFTEALKQKAGKYKEHVLQFAGLSQNIPEQDIDEYDSVNIQTAKQRGLMSINISVSDAVLAEKSEKLKQIIETAHKEGLKVVFVYKYNLYIVNNDNFLRETINIAKTFEEYKIDGINLDLSESGDMIGAMDTLVALGLLQKRIKNLAVKMPQTTILENEWKGFFRERGIKCIADYRNIKNIRDKRNIIVDVTIDKQSNSIFDTKELMDMFVNNNITMVSFDSGIIEALDSANEDFTFAGLKNMSDLLNAIFNTTPEGQYVKGVIKGRSIKISDKQADELFEFKRSGINMAEKIKEYLPEEIKDKQYSKQEAEGIAEGMLEEKQMQQLGAEKMIFADRQYADMFKETLVRYRTITGNSYTAQNKNIEEVLSQMKDNKNAEQLRELLANNTSAANTELICINILSSMYDDEEITASDRAVVLEGLLTMLLATARHVENMDVIEKMDVRNISAILRAA